MPVRVHPDTAPGVLCVSVAADWPPPTEPGPAVLIHTATGITAAVCMHLPITDAVDLIDALANALADESDADAAVLAGADWTPGEDGP